MRALQHRWIPGLVLIALLAFACGNRTRNRATMSMNHGIEQYERGNFDAAIRYLEEAATIDPEFGEPQYYLGMIRLVRYSAPEGAIANLERATALMPEHAASHYYLGWAYLEHGDRRAARQELERAVELDPDHSRAHYRYGTVLEGDGEMQGAIEAYIRSIHADPRFELPYHALGMIYARYEATEAAIAVFREGFENTDHPVLANELARLHLQEGQREAALTFFRAALDREPTSIGYNYNLGVAYADLYRGSQDPRDRERAMEYLTQAGGRCGQLRSQARCNAIRQLLEDLDQSPQ